VRRGASLVLVEEMCRSCSKRGWKTRGEASGRSERLGNVGMGSPDGPYTAVT